MQSYLRNSSGIPCAVSMTGSIDCRTCCKATVTHPYNNASYTNTCTHVHEWSSFTKKGRTQHRRWTVSSSTSTSTTTTTTSKTTNERTCFVVLNVRVWPSRVTCKQSLSVGFRNKLRERTRTRTQGAPTPRFVPSKTARSPVCNNACDSLPYLILQPIFNV